MSTGCDRSARLQVGSLTVARLLQRVLRLSRSHQLCRSRLCIPPVPTALRIGLSEGTSLRGYTTVMYAAVSIASRFEMGAAFRQAGIVAS